MSQRNLVTKAATEEDFEFCWNVYEAAVKALLVGDGKREWSGDEKQQFREIWKKDESHLVLLDGVSIGWAGFHISGEIVEVTHLYFLEEFRNQGYGAKLVEEMVGRWEAEGKEVRAAILTSSHAVNIAKKHVQGELQLDKLSSARGESKDIEVFRVSSKT